MSYIFLSVSYRNLPVHWDDRGNGSNFGLIYHGRVSKSRSNILGGVSLRRCTFNEAQTGVLTLAPHAHGRLALVLMGNSIEGLVDIVSLATPTIPPMTRSPVPSCYTTLYLFCFMGYPRTFIICQSQFCSQLE